jgi:glycosyltransferase involved in cell wall biosynthesis
METNIIADWFTNLHTPSYNIWDDVVFKNRYLPKISLIVPVYNTKESWLIDCLSSVYNQMYPYWELCICNNGSTDPHVAEVLDHFAQDPTDCVKIINLDKNVNGADGTNAAMTLATGEYLALLDSDDVLMSTALFRIVQALNNNPLAKILYTDEIFMNSDGQPYRAFFKPDFDADLLCLIPYLGHLTAYHHNIISPLQFSGGSYDYDLILRTIERVESDSIIHVPYMEYKYRIYQESTSHLTYKECRVGGLSSLQAHLDRTLLGATASMTSTDYQVMLASGVMLKSNARVKPYKNYPSSESHVLSYLEVC